MLTKPVGLADVLADVLANAMLRHQLAVVLYQAGSAEWCKSAVHFWSCCIAVFLCGNWR